ncbi:hypothetical protein L6452_32611 [Arctium lappa]|uniref:Uncharacterized protein n=1 Tax=Arctium lappa TaxID=4217 RepID=A0ACB8Z5A8_ARCLA|nr:hypothetical protein L6452_32611 [Arctium lappa]
MGFLIRSWFNTRRITVSIFGSLDARARALKGLIELVSGNRDSLPWSTLPHEHEALQAKIRIYKLFTQYSCVKKGYGWNFRIIRMLSSRFIFSIDSLFSPLSEASSEKSSISGFSVVKSMRPPHGKPININAMARKIDVADRIHLRYYY